MMESTIESTRKKENIMITEPIPSNAGVLLRAWETDAFGFHLAYALYRRKLSVRGEHAYSIAVRISSPGYADSAFACDVTRSRTRAVRLFDAVTRGLVTPCTLFDVLEDLL